MEIYELPDKKFKVIVVRKLGELKIKYIVVIQ